MQSEIFKRINTGLILFLLLILMFISKTIYLFISICVFTLSFIEFTKISKLIFNNKYFKQFFANCVFVLYLFLFLMIFIISLNDIHLKIILFIILLICISSDIGGILFGKIFKGPKLTKISPKKTYAGLIGSFILSIIAALIYVKYINLGQAAYLEIQYLLLENDLENLNLYFLIIILFISLISQIGDLIISYFKRSAKVKDTGNLLPGHGGLLDRVDGIIFAIPASYILFDYLK